MGGTFWWYEDHTFDVDNLTPPDRDSRNLPSRPASSRLPKPISFPPANCGFTKNKNMDNDQIIELARLHLSVDPPTPGGPSLFYLRNLRKPSNC